MGSTNNTASQSVAGAAQSARGNTASIDTTSTPAAPPTPTPSALSGSVGINAQNNSDDVWQVSSGLAANGYLDAPPRDATPEMQSKIITAQQDMGDLKPDGLVNPGGPTETRFQQLAGQGFMKAPSQETAFGKSPAATPNPSEVKDGTTAKAFARMQQDKQDAARAEASEDRQRQDAQAVNAVKAAKTDQKAATMMAQIQAAASTKAPATTKPESLLPHKDMLREGQDEGLRNGQTAPDIGADAFQSNQRTAEFVKSRNTLGDLPKFTVDAINSDDEDDGVKAMNEVSNLIHQIAETDPAKAQDLLHRTREGLTPERRDQFEVVVKSSGKKDDPSTPTEPQEPSEPNEPDQPPKPEEPGDPEKPKDDAAIKSQIENLEAEVAKYRDLIAAREDELKAKNEELDIATDNYNHLEAMAPAKTATSLASSASGGWIGLAGSALGAVVTGIELKIALEKMRRLRDRVYSLNVEIQTYRENLSSYLAQLEQLRSQLEHSK